MSQQTWQPQKGDYIQQVDSASRSRSRSTVYGNHGYRGKSRWLVSDENGLYFVVEFEKMFDGRRTWLEKERINEPPKLKRQNYDED